MLDDEQDSGISRKNFIVAVGLGALALPAAMGAARVEDKPKVKARPLAPTPSCDDGDEPTPPEIEGPYFKPNSPLRTSLIEPGTAGTRLTLTGVVYSRSCQPVDRALLDFWQCDAYGNYDNYGYRLRGHQYTDAAGRFTLTTIRPGLYPGRTRHIHVKVQAPNQPILTTQLYFPGEPRNQSDPYFHPELVMAVQRDPAGLNGTFDFMLNIP
jgi:protocatechuate 3,4-dioxygenase beta subunit